MTIPKLKTVTSLFIEKKTLKVLTKKLIVSSIVKKIKKMDVNLIINLHNEKDSGYH